MQSEPKSTSTIRNDALRASWIACGMRCSYDHWLQSFADWDVMPVVVSGEIVGAVFGNGPEIHVAVLPEHHRRWCVPSLWRWAVTDRQKRYGYVMTKGAKDNAFILRAGFKPVMETDRTTIFVRKQ